MKYLIPIAAVIIVVTVIVMIIPVSQENGLKTERITITGQEITVEIADTPEERERGLSGRESLGENAGMLFVFEEPGLHSFWMKDMNFPIDIVWIDEDGKIIGITGNVAPDTFPQTFLPPEPVVYVLEVPAGWLNNNNVRVGSIIDIR